MIPFPKMHIAASVLNRIFNTLEGEPQLAIPQPTPIPPLDPIAQGEQIDIATSQPTAPVGAPPGLEQPAIQGAEGASAEGGSPFDGALMGVTGQ